MAAPQAPARRRRALLVATASYSDPGLAALRAPVGDVQALAGVLRDDAIGGFEVSELIDRPTEEIKREIEGFFDEGVALLRLTDDTPTIVVAAEDADLDAAVLVAGDNGTATAVGGLGRRVVEGDAAGLRLGR
jgi:hypothetical protein